MRGGRSLYQKLWDDHVVAWLDADTARLWIDRVMLYEGTSFLAFTGLEARGLAVRDPGSMLAVPDHMLPTEAAARRSFVGRERDMVTALAENCSRIGIPHIGLDDPRQGIVHVVGPEQGFTLPGTTLVCADSHTSTHGAFGALAFGVGTSDLEMVLATRTFVQRPSAAMRIALTGTPGLATSAKDLALAIIRRIGAGGGAGAVLEFTGPAVAALSMEARMTLCNMAVEAGARSGLIAPDDTTVDWLDGRLMVPRGDAWVAAKAHMRTLFSDPDAIFDREALVDVEGLAPQVTWGTSPEEGVAIDGRVPDPRDAPDAARRDQWARAQAYMALTPGTALRDVRIDRVFIGSCTNGRLEDLRAAAAIAATGTVAPHVTAMVVPGSMQVRLAAEAEGLDAIFRAARFEWRMPGCSMCFGSSFDSVGAGQRCASTSNRNFEHRQGRGARTHLMNPAMAAAAAMTGHLTDVRQLL